MVPPIRLWLVEDEARYRQSFEQLIATTDAFVLTGSFECYENIPAIAGLDGPDLVVMDLELPGASGVEATREITRHHPGVPVVVLTLIDRAEAVFGALRAGASGYLVKGSRPDQILRALTEAHAGGTYFTPAVARHVFRFFSSPAPENPLSDRETDVLRALAEGLSKARIAERLFLSPHTVDSHQRSIYVKLHVHTAAEATAKGVRSGLI